MEWHVRDVGCGIEMVSPGGTVFTMSATDAIGLAGRLEAMALQSHRTADRLHEVKRAEAAKMTDRPASDPQLLALVDDLRARGLGDDAVARISCAWVASQQMKRMADRFPGPGAVIGVDWAKGPDWSAR